jgi:hypothetical protein
MSTTQLAEEHDELNDVIQMFGNSTRMGVQHCSHRATMKLLAITNKEKELPMNNITR